jgi:hypothetical protein
MGLSNQPSKGDPLRERGDLQRSTSSTPEQTISLVDGAHVSSGVNDQQAAMTVDAYWLAEYQPNGANLWFIRDWGIASMLGYVRNNAEAELFERLGSTDEAMGMKPVESTEGHLLGSDQSIIASTEREIDVNLTGPGEHGLQTSKQQTTRSVRPWPEETVAKAAEAVVYHRDILRERTEVPAEADAELATEIHSDTRASDYQDGLFAEHSHPRKEGTATDFPEEVVKAAWRRQAGRCARCGRWLTWSDRGKDSATRGWQSQYMIPEDKGGRTTIANCVILCSVVPSCHSNTGHGVVQWGHYAPLDDSVFLFLFAGSATSTGHAARVHPKRSLLREVLGIPQPKKGNKRPGCSVDDSSPRS